MSFRRGDALGAASSHFVDMSELQGEVVRGVASQQKVDEFDNSHDAGPLPRSRGLSVAPGLRVRQGRRSHIQSGPSTLGTPGHLDDAGPCRHFGSSVDEVAVRRSRVIPSTRSRPPGTRWRTIRGRRPHALLRDGGRVRVPRPGHPSGPSARPWYKSAANTRIRSTATPRGPRANHRSDHRARGAPVRTTSRVPSLLRGSGSAVPRPDREVSCQNEVKRWIRRRARVANTAAWVRRSMPSFARRFDT